MAANSSPAFINGRNGIFDKQPLYDPFQDDSPVFLPNGQFLVNVYNGVIRLNEDGSRDFSFGMIRPPDADGGTIKSADFHLLDDGAIIVGGHWHASYSPWKDGFGVYRVKADGSIDPAFGAGKGWAAVDVGAYDSVASTLVQSDGKILVVGTTQSAVTVNGQEQNAGDTRTCIVRFTADGKPDVSFGNNGVMLGGLEQITLKSAVLQNDGKILAIGTVPNAPFFQAAVFRFNADGTPDASFGADGIARITFSGQRQGYSSLGALTLQPDGKILVAGSAPGPGDPFLIAYNFAVARLTTDGQLDPDFGKAGTVLHYVAPDQGNWIPGGSKYGSSHAESVLLREDGTILVAGATNKFATGDGKSSGQFGVLALKPDGSTDVSYGNKGVSTIGAGDDWYLMLSGVGLDPAGRLLILGDRTPGIGGSSIFTMARLNADGAPDASFGDLAISSPARNSITWHESLPAARLNDHLMIQDSELAATGFAGSSLSLARKGGANASDLFSTSGNLVFDNGKVMLGQREVGTVSMAAGALRIDFTVNAFAEQVNEVLQSITYQNAHDVTVAEQVLIEWTFKDGTLAASFETSVDLQPAAAPAWIEPFLSPSGRAALSAGQKLGFALTTDPGAKAFSTNVVALLSEMRSKLAATINIKLVAGIVEDGPDLVIHSSAEMDAGQAQRQAWDADGAAIFVRPPNSGDAATTVQAVQTQLAKLLGLQDPGVGLAPFGTLEIAALQFLYGPSATTRTGNDVYLLDAAKNAFIWDGAGNDTISAAKLTNGVTIHLQPGHWDSIGAKAEAITAAGQFTVNFGSVIENAIGGSGNDHLLGTASANTLQGGAGNDLLEGMGGSDKLDGGVGLDTAAFTGKRSDHVLKHGADGKFTVSFGPDTVSLTGVERLKFGDSHVAIDIDGNAGQVLRLYQAVFNRAPDPKGLGFWIDARDQGMSLGEIAVFFTQSAEFKTLYGAEPTTTQLLTKLYQYALHRAPDASGLEFWRSVLDERKIGLGELLVNFSESPENKAQVIGSIQDGISYTL